MVSEKGALQFYVISGSNISNVLYGYVFKCISCHLGEYKHQFPLKTYKFLSDSKLLNPTVAYSTNISA